VYDRLHYLNENLKEMNYQYDLVSGNVNEVQYQKGKYDEFRHRYAYDADNRLVRAYTSRDGVIWEKESKYFYYAHGPVARVETGDKTVQGQDYAYTIMGWIKGVNSTTLNESRDIGKDGKTGAGANLNKWFGRDAYGYSLGYFTNDYKSIDASLNTAANSFTSVETTQPNDFIYNSKDLYNGNISRMVTVMRDATGNVIPVLARSYYYDQLNRIKEANAYGDATVGTNNYWSSSGTNDLNSNYQEIFTYDWNGNIKTALRNGDLTGTHQNMDNLTYGYNYDLNNHLVNNKLTKATDAATALATDYGNDIDAGQGTNNYTYDEIGNMIGDASEEIAKVEWNNAGKIVKITRTNGSTKADLEFLYNGAGQRVAKIVKPRIGGNASTEEKWEYTVYGGGNIYKLSYSGSGNNWTLNYDLKEQAVSVGGRIGISYDQQVATTRTLTSTANNNGMFDLAQPNTFTGTTQTPTVAVNHKERKLGNKVYELANHLGNVMSTVSDRRIAVGTGVVVQYYLPEVMTYTDYYAFGSTMSGRTYVNANGKYRYGFNGKEDDPETDLQDYGMRIYNAALGKFLSEDPLTRGYPWYTPYQFAGNKPIRYIDLDGAEEYDPFYSPSPEDEINEGIKNIINGAIDGLGNIVAVLTEWCNTDETEGAVVRAFLTNAGITIGTSVTDETLGETFKIRKRDRDVVVEVDGDLSDDLIDIGVGVLNVIAILPWGPSGSGQMLCMTVQPVVAAEISTVVRVLQIAARTKELMQEGDAAIGTVGREFESEAGALFEEATGWKLARTADKVGDFVIKSGAQAGKIIDHMGPPKGLDGFVMNDFLKSIDSHLLKQGVDFILLDLRAFSAEQKTLIWEYVSLNHAKDMSKIIRIQ
jgi:RHS repeat-associated protein